MKCGGGCVWREPSFGKGKKVKFMVSDEVLSGGRFVKMKVYGRCGSDVQVREVQGSEWLGAWIGFNVPGKKESKNERERVGATRTAGESERR